jgi:hypothetical protein
MHRLDNQEVCTHIVVGSSCQGLCNWSDHAVAAGQHPLSSASGLCGMDALTFAKDETELLQPQRQIRADYTLGQM